jgi:hypothetical protein
MKNRFVVQPGTVHTDTQVQSEPVVGLYLSLRIKRMLRSATSAA